MNNLIRFAVAGLLVLFGCLTLFLSSSVLFDWFGIREREGNYVLLVVWANFFCGLIYLASAFGLWKAQGWAVKLLAVAGGILLVAFAGLWAHINAGGLCETRTIGAMIFRMAVTAGFALASYFTLHRKSDEPAN